MLTVVLLIQLFRGFFLTFFYRANVLLRFERVVYIIKDVNYGWTFRLIHSNFASLFFLFLYLHIMRNIFYNSIKFKKLWISGFLIYLILIIIAFIGYVLVWGQISLWGRTVITNLLRIFPFGNIIIILLWGRFSINNPLIQFFYSLHFIFPFILLLIVVVHFYILHIKGSNNTFSVLNNNEKIKFYNYFLVKDIFTIIYLIIFLTIVIIKPIILLDRENSIKANYIISPIHIQPEWYFLYIYAVLRSIPNKVGGVLFSFIIILLIFLLIIINFNFDFKTYWVNKISNCLTVYLFILLSWIGAKPIEYPFFTIGFIFSIGFFTILLFKIVFSFFLKNILS